MPGLGGQGGTFPIVQIIVVIEAARERCDRQVVVVDSNCPSGDGNWTSGGGESKRFKGLGGRRIGAVVAWGRGIIS